MTAQIGWLTKYRYLVLVGDFQKRVRSFLIQMFDVEDIHIPKGDVSKDHVQIEYRPGYDISHIVKKFKGRTSRKIQKEFSASKKSYWGRHFWAIGYGCWSIGNITDGW